MEVYCSYVCSLNSGKKKALKLSVLDDPVIIGYCALPTEILAKLHTKLLSRLDSKLINLNGKPKYT